MILFFLLLWERLSLNKSIRSIPTRILVNGTRGKSTVVKYIARLLRNNGIITTGKVTGVIPTFIKHDGSTHEIKRRGGARITEQFNVIRKAAKLNSDALVIECMSIKSELQQIESRVLKPQFYIITNIREDHLEEMGKRPEEWIKSVCSAIPNNSTVITSEREYTTEIKRYAEKSGSKFIHADEIDFQFVKAGKPNLILDNIKIALLIARELNLETGQFLEDIILDKEKSIIQKTTINGKAANFINAFAVNDVPSAEELMDGLRKRSMLDNDTIIIFNSRADRPLRSIKFANWFSRIKNISRFVITGDNIQNTIRAMKKVGINKNSIVKWNNKQSKNAKEILKEYINEDSTIIGIGNIKGNGFGIINSMNQQ